MGRRLDTGSSRKKTGERRPLRRMTSNQKRVMLWAIPRSLSTAMCRVMMNSGKATQVWDT